MRTLRQLATLLPGLGLLAASLLTAYLGSPPGRPAPSWEDRLPLPKAVPGKEHHYHLSERTRFYVDGAEVTAGAFTSAEDRLVVDEIVLGDDEEILVLKAHTKGK